MNRLDLQTLLESILGSENVYFQPPETKKLSYPAIVYEREVIRTFHADNIPYRNKIAYSVKYITKDQDSDVIAKMAALPLCRFSRHFVSDNFNHDVFTLYW